MLETDLHLCYKLNYKLYCKFCKKHYTKLSSCFDVTGSSHLSKTSKQEGYVVK